MRAQGLTSELMIGDLLIVVFFFDVSSAGSSKEGRLDNRQFTFDSQALKWTALKWCLPQQEAGLAIPDSPAKHFRCARR